MTASGARRLRLRPGTIDRFSIVAVVAPLVVAAIRVLVGRRYVASGDFALIETNVRDVGSHLLELGPYSRFDWNHPGPAMYYVLAVPYRLFGDSGKGMLIGSLAINIAAIVAAALIARRVGGRVALYGTLGVAALVVHGLGSSGVMSPWNPDLPLLTALVVLVSAWALACGHLRALPVLAVAATFVVQSHVGYAPVVAAWSIAALVFVVNDTIRARSAPTTRRALQWGTGTLAGAVVLWSLPLAQQVSSDRGNLALLASFSTEPGDRSLADGFKIVASAYGVGAPWTTDSEAVQAFAGGIMPTRWELGVVTFVALAIALVVCVVRRDRLPRPLVRLVVLLAVSVPVEVFAVAKIKDAAYPYLVQWLWIGAAATWLTCLWLVAALWPRAARAIGGVLAAALAALVVVNLFTVNGATRPDSDPLQGVVRAFVEPAQDATRNDALVRVQGAGIESAAYAQGLALQLEQLGVAARLPDIPLMHLKTTPDHIDHGDQASTVLTIAGGENQAFNILVNQPGDAARSDIEQLRNTAGFTELSHVTLPPTENQAAHTRERVNALLGAGKITREQATRIEQLDATRSEFALFVSDNTAPLPPGLRNRR